MKGSLSLLNTKILKLSTYNKDLNKTKKIITPALQRKSSPKIQARHEKPPVTGRSPAQCLSCAFWGFMVLGLCLHDGKHTAPCVVFGPLAAIVMHKINITHILSHQYSANLEKELQSRLRAQRVLTNGSPSHYKGRGNRSGGSRWRQKKEGHRIDSSPQETFCCPQAPNC